MKRVRCPKCDQYITFDETQYEAGQSLVFKCPDCGKEVPVFAGGDTDISAETGVPVLAKMPIDIELAKQVDMGVIELFEGDYLSAVADKLEESEK